jgi:lipopolysaccharide transport system permease protein
MVALRNFRMVSLRMSVRPDARFLAARAALGFDTQDIKMLFRFVRMAMRDRFLGSKLGFLWALAQPIIMMAIFTLVFGFILKGKLPGAETNLAYIIWLISGYGPWLSIAECIGTSTLSVVGGVSLIKNLAFKAELLPISAVLVGLVPLVVSVVFLACLLVADNRAANLAWFSMPLVFVLQLLFLAGVGMFLSALTVFARDVAFIIPSFLLMMMFLTPIFYPIEAMPGPLAMVSVFNPFYVLAEGYRQPIVYGQVIPLWSFAYMAVVSAASFLGGLMFFRRLRPYFDARI